MKIWFGTVQLADELNYHCENFSNPWRNGVSQVPLLRALEPKMFDGMNQSHTITFTISRIHESIKAAEVFYLRHATELPATGILKIVSRGEDGQEMTEWYGTPTNPAGLASVSPQPPEGVHTIHNYTFLAGYVRITDPTQGGGT